MKDGFLRLALLFAFICTSWSLLAKPSMSVRLSVEQIIAEFKDVKGVNSMILDKGQGLGLVKVFLRPKLGKEFLEGVTSIIIIEHSKASEEVSAAFQSRLNSYATTLQEFKFNDNEFGGGESVRGYVAIDETMVASDLVMIVEDKGAKLFIYMGGVLEVEKLNLNPKKN